MTDDRLVYQHLSTTGEQGGVGGGRRRGSEGGGGYLHIKGAVLGTFEDETSNEAIQEQRES